MAVRGTPYDYHYQVHQSKGNWLCVSEIQHTEQDHQEYEEASSLGIGLH